MSLAVAQSPAGRGGEVGVEQLRRMDFDAWGPCLRKQMVHHFPLSAWTPRQYYQESLELQDETQKGSPSHPR